MKGIIFNLLEEAVGAEFGDDTWLDLTDIANVRGAYTSLGSYPDEEILALVNAASMALSLSTQDVLRWFGRRALPLLAKRYGDFFVGHTGARSFVLSLNDIIHPEVRKLYTGAGCPHFQFVDEAGSDEAVGRLIIGYQSPRRMCHLAHGFIDGASDHFGQTAQIEHLDCMDHGSPQCRLAVRWHP